MGSAPTKCSTDTSSDNLRDKFVFSYVIGKGGFGRVHSAFHVDSKEWFALKQTNIRQILKHKNGFELLISELSALRRVGRHSCVVGLNAAFHDGRFCYMALDLCTGGDLRYHLKKKEIFCEKRTAFITACIASALRHCHQRGVLHRDVKPENILIDEEGYALLTDFGVSFSSDSHRAHPSGDLICHLTSGTRQYLAPEVFTSSHTHGCASDFWSLGVVAFELTYGQRPFSTHCPQEYIRYAQSHLPHGDGTYITPPCCISNKTGKRPSCFADEGCSLLYLSQSTDASHGVTSGLRRMHFPEVSAVNGYISGSCRRLLNGLLSVNQSRRWGHGEHNYSQLQRTSWFDECGVSWTEVEEGRALSPFHPDLREVSMDICQTFARESPGYTFPSACSTCGNAALMSSSSSVTGRDCGHRGRVLGCDRTRKALDEFFFLAPEYGEFDPALDEAWKRRCELRVGGACVQTHRHCDEFTESSAVPKGKDMAACLCVAGAATGTAVACH